MKLPVETAHPTGDVSFFSLGAQLWKAPKLENLNSVQSPRSHHSGSGGLRDLLWWGRSVWR